MSANSHDDEKKGDPVEITQAVHIVPSRAVQHHIAKEEKELDVAAGVSFPSVSFTVA